MSLLEVLIIVILLLWLTGNFVFSLGSAVHLLLLVLVVLIIVRVMQGRSVL
jgi:ABC-type sulfate transport system permease component